MTYGLLGVGLIFFILFLLYKIIRFAFHICSKGFRKVKNVRSKPHYLDDDRFPEAAFRACEISQNEFSRIANRNAYRNQRVENVDVEGNTVSIEIRSQTGLSLSHAQLTFTLSGASIGDYSIRSDNPDSSIPLHICDRIKADLRSSAGLN